MGKNVQIYDKAGQFVLNENNDLVRVCDSCKGTGMRTRTEKIQRSDVVVVIDEICPRCDDGFVDSVGIRSAKLKQMRFQALFLPPTFLLSFILLILGLSLENESLSELSVLATILFGVWYGIFVIYAYNDRNYSQTREDLEYLSYLEKQLREQARLANVEETGGEELELPFEEIPQQMQFNG